MRSTGIRTTLLAGLVWLSLASPALATPTASPTPDAPLPELCQVAPRSLDELNEIVATPSSRSGTPVTDVVPEGDPADPETAGEVVAVVREFVACQNAGELFRVYGLYTEDYLRDLFWRQPPMSQADYDALATPLPAPEGARATILEITDIRVFPDGRAGATVTIRYAVIPMPKLFYFSLVPVGDRWMIDDILGEITFSLP
jgi:hypothetical protein